MLKTQLSSEARLNPMTDKCMLHSQRRTPPRLAGMTSGIAPEHSSLAGLFGTAVATMGMLSTAVYVLSMSSFGPIADNAGGIVEMSYTSTQVCESIFHQ